MQNINKHESIALKGHLVSGRKRASTDIKNNLQELQEFTGEGLYLGSLNLILDKPVRLNSKYALSFDSHSRMIWPGWINNVGNVWLYRWKSCPLHVVEVLSKSMIREKLGVEDGENIDVVVSTKILEQTSFKDKVFHQLIWSYREPWYYSKDWYTYNRLIELLRTLSSQGNDNC